MFGRQRRRVLARQGRFVLRLDARERELIRQLLGELRELLALSPHGPARAPPVPGGLRGGRGARGRVPALTREELQSGRLASIDAVEASVDAEVLDAEQLRAWMQAVNSLRLVLGTMLDITDDDQELASTRTIRTPHDGAVRLSRRPARRDRRRPARRVAGDWAGRRLVVGGHDHEHRQVGDDARAAGEQRRRRRSRRGRGPGRGRSTGRGRRRRRRPAVGGGAGEGLGGGRVHGTQSAGRGATHHWE